jgi:NAD(P)-dependent dehydrogenase (short-subunit alcohol dehydrogenase family)
MMSAKGAVLLTGASTGIGYATTYVLAKHGFIVFAGVRTEEDSKRLQSLSDNVRPVYLDVQKPNDIADVTRTIDTSGVPLRGVVNNAGIAVAGPLECLPLEDLRRQFDVNVFGAVAVTQAALPLLRRGNGRIVFVSSVSGQIAPPFLGPYAASKFAIEALADSLRMELSQFGIRVSVIQPGNVKTPIWKKGRDEHNALLERMPAVAREYYEAAFDALVAATHREERTGIAPEVVGRTVLQALTAARPRARYAVGSPAAWQRRMAALLPEHLRDRLILRTVRGKNATE